MNLATPLQQDRRALDGFAVFITPQIRALLHGLLRGVAAAGMAGCLTCVAYLCKCKMGIDLFEGPSCLHNALYWIVR